MSDMAGRARADWLRSREREDGPVRVTYKGRRYRVTAWPITGALPDDTQGQVHFGCLMVARWDALRTLPPHTLDEALEAAHVRAEALGLE